MDKLSNYATTISTSANGKDICVVYHSTCIVQFNDDTITLRTGGYDTVTTRRKMNQASRQFGLGYYVQRDKGVTYVGNRIGRVELENVMMLDRRHYANREAA